MNERYRFKVENHCHRSRIKVEGVEQPIHPGGCLNDIEINTPSKTIFLDNPDDSPKKVEWIPINENSPHVTVTGILPAELRVEIKRPANIPPDMGETDNVKIGDDKR